MTILLNKKFIFEQIEKIKKELDHIPMLIERIEAAYTCPKFLVAPYPSNALDILWINMNNIKLAMLHLGIHVECCKSYARSSSQQKNQEIDLNKILNFIVPCVSAIVLESTREKYSSPNSIADLIAHHLRLLILENKIKISEIVEKND